MLMVLKRMWFVYFILGGIFLAAALAGFLSTARFVARAKKAQATIVEYVEDWSGSSHRYLEAPVFRFII